MKEQIIKEVLEEYHNNFGELFAYYPVGYRKLFEDVLKKALQKQEDKILELIEHILNECRIDKESLTWKELYYTKQKIQENKSNSSTSTCSLMGKPK
jgi:hypothetical protein